MLQSITLEEEDKFASSKSMESSKDSAPCRKEKRKLLKKLKRKQIRKEIALKQREEEDANLNNEEEQKRMLLQQKEEEEEIERQRKEFEQREREWMEKAAKKEQEKKLLEENVTDDDWEYVEEGPAEIIWQGNEIIVKKKKVKVPKTKTNLEDVDRPTSNPLPPQSEAYASSYRNTSVSSQQVFESVSHQNSNFGTEQDKAHCPFHIKTGACRFGVRCSRAHFYPDKSCTLLIKNMYNGPGLTLEQDEGLECTDEEIDRGYEEFYEDVHTEFLKFGEIINFKACRNGSIHLRGNVYVHYKSLESAILAYQTINGRYFGGKQITCEYVGVTKWRVAICGEYMKSRLKTCSRGTACNFIHCFRNPGGDYEWADWDNPPPKYWVRKMAALFGPSDEVGYDKQWVEESLDHPRHSKKRSAKHERNHSRRSRFRDTPSIGSSSGGEDAGGRRDQRSTSNRRRHSSSREHKPSIDERKHRDEDLYIENGRYENKNTLGDHGLGDYSNDTDEYYSQSRASTHRHCKEQNGPQSDDNSRQKDSYSERSEGRDRLGRRGLHREYDGLQRDRKRSYSSRWDHASKWRKADHDDNEKSDNYDSDSPHSDYRSRKSEDSSFGPNSINHSERWESGTSFKEERKPSRHPDSEESLPQRHRPHGQRSRGHDYELKSRKQSSYRAHSERREDERDSSSDEGVHYNGKSRIHNDLKGKRKRLYEDQDFSSGDSKERSEAEQKETDKSRQKHGGSSQLQERGSERGRGHTKTKHENDNVEVSVAHEHKRRRRSRRSKSR